MRYYIPYEGFAIVEADSEEEAVNKAENGETTYEEMEWGDASPYDE